MPKKDTEFYNKESSVYSQKRYPSVAKSYTQFFFKERLRFTINSIREIIKGKQDLSLLEIGCADGIVLEHISKELGTQFSQLIGIDISPGMIHAAQKKYKESTMIFKERKDYTGMSLHDLIVEIGVINYASLADELEYIASHVKAGGHAIISLAGTGSLWDKRRKDDTGFNNFFSYSDYEREIMKHFTIIKRIPVGLPIPVIWRVPVLARVIESLAEKCMREIAPDLFHEKVYILKASSMTQG
jgi:SAM-dependent methyltransferase